MRSPRTGLVRLATGLLMGTVVVGCSEVRSSTRPREGGASPQAAVPPEATTPITLAFAGDVHFEGRLANVPRRDASTLGPMSRVLRQADLTVVNLESAVTERGRPAPKEREVASNRFWFRSPPAALDVLDRSGVDVASVANNHGADYGVTGLRDTVRAGGRSDVAVLGVGLDAAAAFAPYRTTIEGTDVAVLAADASPRESADSTWAASPGSGPGIASARGPAAQLVEAVQASARVDDLVVVYLHWGEEGNGCATGSQRELARTLTAAGADIVVGTHAHLPVGAGLLGGGAYVSYGLGNFFWYHGNTAETGVLRLTVQGDEVVDDRWVPAEIGPEGGNPRPLAGTAVSDAVSDWRSLRACTDLVPGPAAAAGDLPAYTSTVSELDAEQRARLRASSPASCPVPLADLRHLSVSYVGFDGRAHQGELIVAADVAQDVVVALAALYESRFPVQRMRPVDEYDGDDDRSMAANNTSAYNCRRVAGSTTWSDHAYGRAIDVNPLQNPYVVGGDVRPPAAQPYLGVDRTDRAEPRPGVITDGDAARRAFARLGWSWGGDYADPDFQHFSAG